MPHGTSVINKRFGRKEQSSPTMGALLKKKNHVGRVLLVSQQASEQRLDSFRPDWDRSLISIVGKNL